MGELPPTTLATHNYNLPRCKHCNSHAAYSSPWMWQTHWGNPILAYQKSNKTHTQTSRSNQRQHLLHNPWTAANAWTVGACQECSGQTCTRSPATAAAAVTEAMATKVTITSTQKRHDYESDTSQMFLSVQFVSPRFARV